MDPTNPAGNPTGSPVAPVSPATPQQPVAPAPGVQPPAPLSPQAPMPGMVQPLAPGQMPTGSGKSKKGLIIGIVVAVVAVVVVLGLLIALPAMALLQAKSRSDGFMKAMTAGDTKTALTFVKDGGDSEDKTFLEAAASKVKGNYSFKEASLENSKYYALYTLSGGDYKSARTEMTKTSGVWYVDGFVYDTQELKLIPSTSTSDSSSKPDTTTKTTTDTSTASGACLTDSDVAPLTGGTAYGTDLFEGGRTYVGDTYFFQPDSTTYTYPDQTAKYTQQVADWFANNKTKNFTIRLSGKVHESGTTQSGITLSNQRAQKIKDELVSKGVTASMIVIDPPQESSATYNDGSERNVDLSLLSPKGCEVDSSSSNR